jgi:hypothetical protein
MRYVVLLAACVLLACIVAGYLPFVGLEMTDDIFVYVGFAKDIAGVVLAAGALYLWFSRGGGRATAA